MRRGVSDDRATKQALIAKLAAAKKQTENGSRPNRPIIGLSDSSDEDADKFASSDSELSQNTSDLEADEMVPVVAPTTTSFNRLRKQHSESTEFSGSGSTVPTASIAADSVADSLVNGMQGLSVAGGAGGKSTINNITTITTQSFGTDPSKKIFIDQHIEKEKEDEKEKDGAINDKANCLVLEDPSRPVTPHQFRLSPKLSSTLYPHQIEGVTWLYGLWKVGAGGILADDMGLGKTMQTSAFLSGVLLNKLASRALILAPTTLLSTWEKELKACGLGELTHQYYGTPTERERALKRVVGANKRGVILTTYGMVLHNAEVLAQHAQHDPDDGPLWDLIIMDEGHKLKNPKMQLRARVEILPVRQRLILSGTPIQNNLMEMHALFDLVCPGLLGDSKSFKDHYEKRITAGNDKYATIGERERGAATATALRSAIAPHMLRREKKDVFGDETSIQKTSSELTNVEEGTSIESTTSSTTEGTFLSATPDTSSNTDTDIVTTSTDTHNTTPTINTSFPTSGAVPGSMPRKNDFVVWLRLKPNQRALYESFLNSDSVRQVLNRTKSALASLTVLKKICDHPALLSERAAEGIVLGAERAARKAQGLDGKLLKKKSAREEKKDGNNLDEDIDEISASSDSEDEEEEKSDEELEEGEYQSPTKYTTAPNAVGALKHPPDTTVGVFSDHDTWLNSGLEHKILDDLHKTGFEASCKTVFVLSLLRNLVAHGHRTLVFSQSRVMLDILEAAVRAEGWRLCRIDGTVSAQERAHRVNKFQTTLDIPLFLLTSQVGGLGLTLTAADRVIVVDPAWNPSVDSQSVDRAYRIGQKRDVVVYRLISCGTVEDKIYRKQVFKGGLSRTGMQDGEQFRYFSAAELRDMFRLDPIEAVESSTQKQLHALHAQQRQSTPELENHLQFLTSLEGFSGISDHDLLYSVKEVEGNGAPEMGSAAAGLPVQAEYHPGFAVPSPLKRNNRGGGGGGGRSQEWGGGGGDISTMFGKMLSLGNTNTNSGGGGGSQFGIGNKKKVEAPSYEASTAALATAPSIDTGGRISDASSLSDFDIQQKQLESLQLQLGKQESMLSNPVLVAGLVDGGAKIKARAEQLRQDIMKLDGVLECKKTQDQQCSLFNVDGDPLVAAERQQGVYLPALGAAVVPPPPPSPPAPSTDQPSSQTLSPFQRIKSSILGLIAGSNATPAVEVPPPPPRPPPPHQEHLPAASIAPADSAFEQQEQQTNVSDTTKEALKELKWQLYQRAKELAAAEACGNTTMAAALRREVDVLYTEYESAKEASNAVCY